MHAGRRFPPERSTLHGHTTRVCTPIRPPLTFRSLSPHCNVDAESRVCLYYSSARSSDVRLSWRVSRRSAYRRSSSIDHDRTGRWGGIGSVFHAVTSAIRSFDASRCMPSWYIRYVTSPRLTTKRSALERALARTATRGNFSPRHGDHWMDIAKRWIEREREREREQSRGRRYCRWWMSWYADDMAAWDNPESQPLKEERQPDEENVNCLPSPLFSGLIFPLPRLLLLRFSSRANSSRTGHATCSRLTSQILPRRVGFRSVSLSVSGLASPSSARARPRPLAPFQSRTTARVPASQRDAVGFAVRDDASRSLLAVSLFLNDDCPCPRYVCRREDHPWIPSVLVPLLSPVLHPSRGFCGATPDQAPTSRIALTNRSTSSSAV